MVVCGGVWWFVVVCGGLRWFAVVCGGLSSFSHRAILRYFRQELYNIFFRILSNNAMHHVRR